MGWRFGTGPLASQQEANDMAWRALAVGDIRLTPAEQAMLKSAQNVTTGLEEALDTVKREFLDALAANNQSVNTDGTVPDQLRRHIMAQAVWSWLRDFPQLKTYKTDERKAAASDAEKVYEKICNRTFGAILSPSGVVPASANWNSQPKVLGRMTPIPQPDDQLQPVNQVQRYANPNAPTDTVTFGDVTVIRANLFQGHGLPSDPPFYPNLVALYTNLDDGVQYVWIVEAQKWDTDGVSTVKLANLLQGHGAPASAAPDTSKPALYTNLDDGVQYVWNVETQAWV